ncbi:isoleucyl-tRNA synthetase [Candidatus Uzinura diaspidicola str. ASNER]|uniref:Isoleucine--tRNA ligase n=1 Tax=Candidatus Uzinura diaspidicola str. ASNER TaxID=1133592 RepID=L7VFW3_9FLAO|nr:isoleucyl-tRNA synthetase [Candidatus Uzinura diaspidicola str. ASNER]
MRFFKEKIKLDLNISAKIAQKYWRKDKIFKRSISSKKGKKKWVFYEGPPSSNGIPGIHHLLGCTIKDIFCRYKTIKGKQVHRKAGWDTHGLPIELGVENFLNIKKEDIGEKISIYEYNKICYTSVIRYIDIWKQLTDEIGYWIDQEDAYITYNSKYIETIWNMLKNLFERKFIYKGYTVQPYSPIAGTGLSNLELNIPGVYKEITDTTIIAQFKASKKKLPISLSSIEGDIYFLAWTSTPWTLPSNTAIAVGNSIEYVLVETFNTYIFDKIYIIVSKQLLNSILSNKITPYRIIYSFLGKYIIGASYEQLLPWLLPYKKTENAFEVISSDFVSNKEGTGIVHIAPTFGYEDALIAKRHGITSMLVWDKKKNIELPLVDLQGRFIKSLPFPFRGRYVKKEYDKENKNSVDVELALYLKKKGKAFKIAKYRHTYPHCWRTETPILYYPLYSWCIKTSFLIEEMIFLNNTIKWIPFSTGKNRFGYWLRKLNDWNLSRSRYWGIPIPIWRTKNQTEEKIIGSIEELIIEIKKSIEANFMKRNPSFSFIIGEMSTENYKQIDIHKPMIDDIILVSSRGKPMQREEDLVDVWFDSGAMPFAQLHYPFENKDKIQHGKFYPADFISEGVDQTRGWFYTLHAISSMLFRSVAYKNVVSNGLVLDKNGQKMSKSKGNIINPFEILERYGPDAVRCYIISNSLPWENIKFNLSCIDEVRRKFFGTLYNTYAFFALYANIDLFCYKEDPIKLCRRPELDRWILSELHLLIKNVENFYDNYDPTRSIRNISYFVITQLSKWYIRLSRKRFWKCIYSQDKIAAFQTLYEILLVIAKLLAPIAPFFSDILYKDLVDASRKEIYRSVHLSYFPKGQKNLIDIKLQEQMHVSQRIASIVLSLRKKENIKVRQPLKQLRILSFSYENYNKVNYLTELIKQEVNVKKILPLSKEEAENFYIKEIKPNYRLLGPRFGKNIYKISELLIKLSINQINKLEENKYCTIEIEGRKQKIGIEEVDILTKKIKGWSVAFEEDFIIALDIQVDETLRLEGITRDFVSKIQQIRKKSKLKVTDKIILYVAASSFIKKAIILNKDYICYNTLSIYLYLGSSSNLKFKEEKEIEIEEEKLSIFIHKLK